MDKKSTIADVSRLLDTLQLDRDLLYEQLLGIEQVLKADTDLNQHRHLLIAMCEKRFVVLQKNEPNSTAIN